MSPPWSRARRLGPRRRSGCAPPFNQLNAPWILRPLWKSSRYADVRVMAESIDLATRIERLSARRRRPGRPSGGSPRSRICLPWDTSRRCRKRPRGRRLAERWEHLAENLDEQDAALENGGSRCSDAGSTPGSPFCATVSASCARSSRSCAPPPRRPESGEFALRMASRTAKVAACTRLSTPNFSGLGRVVLDRAGAHEQARGGHGVVTAVGQENEHVALSRGKRRSLR